MLLSYRVPKSTVQLCWAEAFHFHSSSFFFFFFSLSLSLLFLLPIPFLVMSTLAVFTIFFFVFFLSLYFLSFSYSHPSYASCLAVFTMAAFFGFNYSDSGLTIFFAVLLILFNKAVLSSYNFPYANVITLFQVPSLLSCSDGLSYTFLSYKLF